MSTRFSPKRLNVEAVRKELKRIRDALVSEQLRRESCQSSWGVRKELAHCEEVSGLPWSADDERQQKEALAGYDRKIKDLEEEVETWEQALSHALDTLEGRV